jgi:hypothetical protein
MNEYALPDWFMLTMICCALVQTALLVVVCVLFRLWAGTLNRKLHRIESNTRHVVSALAREDEAVAEQVA